MSSWAETMDNVGIPVPRIAAGAIVRDGLLQRLERLAPVAVLEGLPGSGKTTLAVQWISQFSAPWKSMWIDGNAIGTMDALDGTLSVLVESCADERVVVVIDDFALPFDDKTIELIVSKVSICPGLYLMLCVKPGNATVRWSRWGRIESQILRQNDLSPNLAELATIIHSWGHSVEPALIERLHATFHGWLRPTRYALDNGDTITPASQFPTTKWQIRKKIMERVGSPEMIPVVHAMANTEAVTEDLLAVLLQQKLPGRKVLAHTSLKEILARMEDQGIIERSTLLASVPVWKIVDPLRDAVKDSTYNEHEELEAHRQVVRYWMSSPYKHAAVHMILFHARAASLWGTLDKLWKEIGVDIFAHQYEALLAYSQVPDAVATQHPQLWAISRLVTSIYRPEVILRGSLVAEEHGSILIARKALEKGRDPHVELLLATEMMGEMRRQGDASAAAKLAQKKYLAYSAEMGRNISREGLAYLAHFEMEWGLSLVLDRKKNAAFQIFKQALEHAKLSEMTFLIAFIAARLAVHSQIVGYTRDAEDLLDLVPSVGTTAVIPRIRSNYVLLRAMQCMDALDRVGTEKYLSQLKDLGERIEQWPLVVLTISQHALMFGDQRRALTDIARERVVFADQLQSRGRNRSVLDRCTADLLLSLGELHRAKVIIESSNDGDAEMVVAKSRLALLSGDFEFARTLAQEASWNDVLLLRDQIGLLLIEATASLETNDLESAVTAYLQAKSATIGLGSRLSLMMCNDSTLRRLEDLSGERDYSFISRPEAVRATVFPSQGSLITLTARESRVLSEMSKCANLSEVADNLSVSLNTVKKQSISIYKKLGVHGRAEAIGMAHRLGLLN